MRTEESAKTMMAATIANTTVHVPWSDMALNEMLTESIPDPEMQILCHWDG